MNRRSLLGFILLNIIVTFVTVFTIVNVWTRLAPQPTRQPVSPIFVAVTTTPDPNATPVAVRIVTATPVSGAAGAPGGSTVSIGTASAVSLAGIPTLDPALLPTGQAGSGGPDLSNPRTGTPGTLTVSDSATSATDKNGCQTYAIRKGDTLGSISTTFGIALADLMRANKLTEADLTRLQIGQVLSVPVNGCGLATEEPSPTPTKFSIPTLLPTVTLAPTASKAQVEIVQVISPGDVTSEGVEIHNISGGVIQMQGWTLTDTKGHTFTFPEYRMFPGGRVTVYTKDGKNTPIVLFWGQSRSIWGDAGLKVTLSDAKNEVQATREVSAPAATGTSGESGSAVPTPTSSNVG